MNARKIFNEIKLLTDHEIGKVKSQLENSLFKENIEVLLYFDCALEKMTASQIFLSKDKENFYTNCIIYRSIIEHYYKAHIVFVSSTSKGNDYGKLFLEHGFKYEMIRYLQKLKPLMEETKNTELLNMMINDLPDLPNLPKLNLVFKYPDLLVELNRLMGGVKPVSDFDDRLIYQYSKLCSYVHGGFDAVYTTYKNEDAYADINTILKTSVSLFISNRMNIFILVYPGLENTLVDKMRIIRDKMI